jgi:S1-C subfamily serine protease
MKFLEIPRISWRNNLDQGEGVYLFGYPNGLPSWSTGTFAYRRHNRDGKTESTFTEVCDIVCNFSSSRDAVFDMFGDVVGVVYATQCPAGTTERSQSLVVPITYVRKLLRGNSLDFLGAEEHDLEVVHTGSFDTREMDDEPPISG